MVDVQTISIVVAAAGVFIAAINSIYSSRRSAKNDELTLETRQAQLFMQIYNRWNSFDLANAYGHIRYQLLPEINDYRDYLENFDPREGGNLRAFSQLLLIYTYFEGLGMLVKKGLLDIELVSDLFDERIRWLGEEMMQYITAIRKRYNDPTRYDSIEYLYAALKQYEQRSTAVNP